MEDKSERKKNRGRRTVKLWCPSVSKIAQLMASEDQRLDIGAIARTFGLEPATLKLNGHFISRGVDLISSSVTWNSLLSFFSSRGLSTGVDGSGALLVDGKPSKAAGTKRTHDLMDVENGVSRMTLYKEGGKISRNPQPEDIGSVKIKKLKEDTTSEDIRADKCSNVGLKRRHWLETIHPLKKSRANGSYSNENYGGYEGKQKTATKLPCGYLVRENTKRMREDELLVAASCKRTR